MTHTPPQELVQAGKQIFDKTPEYAGAYVGSKLSCTDCHLGSGTVAYASPMINLAGMFPMPSKRAGRTITLEDRIQECFTRSEAGRPLPNGSQEMQSLVAYIDWLSKDGIKGQPYEGRGLGKVPALKGDATRGKFIYTAQCAACHNPSGAGVPNLIPALWGPDSFNDGAGMNVPAKMAAFVLHNMPQDRPGTLSPQQAYDVAAYVQSKPRPRFNPAYQKY